MHRQSTGSTSLTPAPDSFDDLAKLGEYILDQLGRDRRTDNLLVHWAAHRLAERMHTADTAEDATERENARDAATVLIAQLWQARAGWPRGWPPDAMRDFVDGVDRAAGRSYPEDPVQLPPWLSSLGELQVLQSEERVAWLNAALLEVGADDLRRAVEVAPNEAPEPEDLADIRRQLHHHQKAEEWLTTHATEGEDPARRADRAQILSRVLTDITERRASLIERTLKDARRGQKRKPTRQAVHGTSRRRRGSRKRPGETAT